LQLVTGVACGDKTARASVRAVDYVCQFNTPSS
jgi:hypothetical protein